MLFNRISISNTFGEIILNPHARKLYWNGAFLLYKAAWDPDCLRNKSTKGSLGENYGECNSMDELFTPRSRMKSSNSKVMWLRCAGGLGRTDVTISWAQVLLPILSSSPFSGDLAQHSVIPLPVTVHSGIPPKLCHTQSNCSANTNQVSINSLEFHQCGPYLYSSGSVKHLNEHSLLSARLIYANFA